jgi:shikimate kinase
MIFFLIGFMGSGKTHWGRIWAAEHQLTFLDLDEAVEVAELLSVQDIFETKGEDYFREIEAKVLRGVAVKDNMIIACGGGTPCFYENMQWMNDKGTTIYITCSPEEILRRLLKAEQKRPLIKKVNHGELLFFIQQKLKEREPFYKQAKIIMSSTKISEKTFADSIVPLV